MIIFINKMMQLGLNQHFCDDKDRVLIRENGQSTYFASDILYHVNKFDRCYDTLIDI